MQQILNSIERVFVSYESIYQPFLSNNSRLNINSYYYEIIRQHHHLSNACLNEKKFEKVLTYETSYHYFGDKSIYQDTNHYKKKLRKAIVSNSIDKVIFIVRDPRDRWLSLQNWVEKRDKSFSNTIDTSTSLSIYNECKKGTIMY